MALIENGWQEVFGMGMRGRPIIETMGESFDSKLKALQR